MAVRLYRIRRHRIEEGIHTHVDRMLDEAERAISEGARDWPNRLMAQPRRG
jgi:hypothetical protein